VILITETPFCVHSLSREIFAYEQRSGSDGWEVWYRPEHTAAWSSDSCGVSSDIGQSTRQLGAATVVGFHLISARAHGSLEQRQLWGFIAICTCIPLTR